MKARQVSVDEADVIAAICRLAAEVWETEWFCNPAEPLTLDRAIYLKLKIERAASNEEGGVGLFAAFDEAGDPQGFSLTRPGRTSLLVCRPAVFDEAAAAVLAEARRVKGSHEGIVVNPIVRNRLARIPGVRIDEAEQRVIFD